MRAGTVRRIPSSPKRVVQPRSAACKSLDISSPCASAPGDGRAPVRSEDGQLRPPGSRVRGDLPASTLRRHGVARGGDASGARADPRRPSSTRPPTGWGEAGDAAVALGMTFLPGMELSANAQVHPASTCWATSSTPGRPDLAPRPIASARKTGSAARRSEIVGTSAAITSWCGTSSGQATPDARWAARTSPTRSIARGSSATGASVRRHPAPARGYYEPHYAPDPLPPVRLITQRRGSGPSSRTPDVGPRPDDAGAPSER